MAPITNDAIILGLLAAILGLVFWTSSLSARFWRRFYGVVPAMLLCYFLPSLLTTFGLVDPTGSKLYFVASRFLLPAALVLLTLSADLPATLKLGPKALIMFFTGSLGVMIGGPLALLSASWIAPDLVAGHGPEAVWRGMSTVAGAWIGGSPNQAALYEIFKVGPATFSTWIAVDVVIGNLWTALLLWVAANRQRVDAALKADTGAVDAVRIIAETYEAENTRIPELKHFVFVTAIGFGGMGLAHFGAEAVSTWVKSHAPGLNRLALDSSFFWLVLLATVVGLALSFTRVRRLQGVGATKIGSLLVYIAVATVGLNMNIAAVLEAPAYFLIGLLWIAIHGALMVGMAFAIRAPSFFLAVGSQANIGGVASAPVVASVFHPSLAPVGVLLGVVGLLTGTFGGWITGLMMQALVGP